MKIAIAILSTGISCSAALAVMIFVLLSCGDLSSSAPAGAVCPSNLAEAMKAAMASCQKETKALEEDATLSVPLPEGVSVKSSALRIARADISEPIGDRRFRRFGRGVTISPVTQEDVDDDEDDAPTSPPPSGKTTTAKFGRVKRAVTEKEDRRRRQAEGVTPSSGGEGKEEGKDRRRRQAGEGVTPSKGEEILKEEEKEGRKERRSVDAHEIVAVAGHHHKKDDDCDDYRRRRGADQQKNGEMLSCAANKLVSEHPVLQKAIDACKEMEEENDQYEECFKNNLKESCPDMPIIE